MQATIEQFNSPTYVKLAGSVLFAAVVTFSLFVLMDKLTQNDTVNRPPQINYVDTDIVLDERPQTTVTKKVLPPKTELKIPDTRVTPTDEPQTPDTVDMSQYTTPKPQINISNKATIGLTNNSATPVVRMQPDYPIDAARKGIEGWVQLQFNIATNGQVKDVRVIDSQPKRVFDKAARKALLRWKYKPSLVEGKPTQQTGMVVVLDFKLDN